jgi:hypothetical protein
MSVPNVFANATTSIPLVQLDQNFNTGITLGNTTVYLGNTTTSFGNVTLTGAAVNGTVGATTPATGAFTTITATGTITSSLSGGAVGFQHVPSTGTNSASFLAGNTGGNLYIGIDDSSGSTYGTAGNYGTVIYRPASTQFALSRGATVDMSFSTTGQMLVGSSIYYNGGQRFQVAGTTGGGSGDYISVFANTESTNPYGIYIKYSNASPNDSSKYFIDARDSTTARFQLYSNGGIANYSANNVNLSDIREKPVFEDYTEQMLDDLQAKFVKLRRGRFILEGQTHSDWNYGKTAQSVAEHIPELSGIWNPTKRVDVQVEELVDGPFLDASGVPVKVRSFQTKTIEVATPEEEQRLCEYNHDIKEIGEALLVRALKKIEELESRIAKLEAAK